MVSSVTGIAKEKQTEKTPETNPTESNQVVVDDGGQGPSGRQDGASAEDDSKIQGWQEHTNACCKNWKICSSTCSNHVDSQSTIVR